MLQVDADGEVPPAVRVARAMRAGAEAVMKYGRAKPGMSTMLDALVPAVEAFEQIASTASAVECTKAMAKAAKDGFEATKTMSAKAGRASYTSEAVQAGHGDPGAFACAGWLKFIEASLSDLANNNGGGE